ncbi:hypothetical protein [Turneriella parva]|uniref:Outer membrane protein beta-barrel domain-containing protein n=1 Tax=Turneriella parva (strain ATCC BAA-1111 / DSM 21527 / NCTC 11395 / H) TaxID=869212 RepID=I4B4H4_TURPD|nr:hypothetical protein [Turneriella parva]AFM12181.1 hypothetical protein Turpa_1533 [Turneriella parva DSM 21527]
MKKILAIFLSAGFSFSLIAQAAGTEPKESQPIVVESEDTGPKSTPVVRTITTKKGYATTTTVPETVTTVTAPEKVLVREGLLTWLSIGLRSSIDYHLTPKEGSLSSLWLYGELYNTSWGIQAGVGYLWTPVTTYTSQLGTTFNGTGDRGYVTFDLIGKYYWWFARFWWIGAGANYAALLGGQLKWYDSATAAAAAASATNPTDATQQAGYARWVDINAGGGVLYAQVGTGLKIAMGNGFNVVNFEPEFRALIPLNAPTGYGTILRFNIGFSYAFGL